MAKSILAAALILAAAVGGGYYWLQLQFVEPGPALQAQRVDVEPGTSVRGVLALLHERGALERPREIELYLRLHGRRLTIKAGTYEIPAAASAAAIVDLLQEGRVVLEALTIVEGSTFAELRRALASDTDVVTTLAGKSDAQVMAAIDRAGEHPEGRFFPDTYRFAARSTDVEILKLAYASMQRVLDEVWSARADNLPLATPYDALILASIVEKETGLASERARIAGVFTARLRLGMRLQSDPTVIYGLGANYDGDIHTRDLTTDTPYNSYTRPGLPPTPIALPGREALRAAVRPQVDGRSVFCRDRGGRRSASLLKDSRGAQCCRETVPDAPAPGVQRRAATEMTAVAAGRFITLEGIEGAGKSTLAQHIAKWLASRGIKSRVTREPGGTPLAERVRAVVLERGGEPVTPIAETLLMFAARGIHLESLIRPALARGEWVVCDRFTDATRAYQAGGRGVSGAWIEELARAVHPHLEPDCTLLLDLPVEVGLARSKRRAGNAPADRFEAEPAQFFERVRAAYLDLAMREPRRIQVIDAAVPLRQVERQIENVLAAFVDLK